jgi:hypothetical protein
MRFARWLLATRMALATTQAFAADKVSFYFAAHENDWQLFMNPSAFEDVLGGAVRPCSCMSLPGMRRTAPAPSGGTGRIFSRARTAPKMPSTSRRARHLDGAVPLPA